MASSRRDWWKNSFRPGGHFEVRVRHARGPLTRLVRFRVWSIESANTKKLGVATRIAYCLLTRVTPSFYGLRTRCSRALLRRQWLTALAGWRRRSIGPSPIAIARKNNAAATSAGGQSWPTAPWQEPMLPPRDFSGLATVTDAAILRVRPGR